MFVGRVMFISLDNEGSNGKLSPLGLAEDFLKFRGVWFPGMAC